jgi:hypothetical protein
MNSFACDGDSYARDLERRDWEQYGNGEDTASDDLTPEEDERLTQECGEMHALADAMVAQFRATS